MADPTISTNRKNVDPSLADLMNLFKKQVMLETNCHAVATVRAFNSENQTISAVINYKKSILQAGQDGVYRTVFLDYPVLLDVPVIVLSGGAAGLTFPIAPGDECLILFNDRALDNWFQSGQIGPLSSTRMHSFSDGIALVGLNSLAHSIADYDALRAVLFNGTTKVGVGASHVLIRNSLYTLNGVLQELVTELTNLTAQLALLTVTGVTTGGGTSGVPVNAAAITAIGVQITATAVKIAGLLE